MKAGRKVLWVVVAVIVLVGAAMGANWLRQRRAQADQPDAGQVVTAFVGDLSSQASASGQLLPQRQARLVLPIAGMVEAITVEVGDTVKQGDLLVQLEADALRSAVASAEQVLAIQEATLAEALKGPRDKELAAARAAVEGAQVQLDELLAGAGGDELAAAQASLEAAMASEQTAEIQREQLLNGATTAEIAAAQTQLAQAEAQQKAAQDAHDLSMTCVTLYCFTVTWKSGSQEVCGPDEGSLRIPDPPRESDPLVSVSEVTQKEHCPTLGPIEEQARANLIAADLAVDAAQQQLDLLLAGPDASQLEIADANVSAAESQVNAAWAQLNLLRGGSNPGQIALARSQLAQAEANLELLELGASEERIAILRAQVEQARIGRQEARDNLDKAVLLAPFDGVVTAVFVTAGEYATGPAVELMDPGSLEVVLNVDEVDIGGLSVGQEARVVLEAWPNQPLTGRVVSIAPKSTVAEVVTFQVNMRLETKDVPVRAGMTANAELVTASREEVVLVPNLAIIADRQNSRFYVLKLGNNGTVEQVEVTIGIKDSRYTEIKGGLAEGEKLVIPEERGLEASDFREGPPDEFQQLRK
jgi:HlyD family secretion protein